MLKELDTIVLTVDLPQHHLTSGDLGAIVFVYNNGEAYEVEFVATDGSTLAVETLYPQQLRHASERKEIPHVREVA
ncbi:MAG: DUF4926 domain-containing protein [Chitinophagales bacterium]|nr:DUF4926 domain-containing protein [Chitinophagales bacterium]